MAGPQPQKLQRSKTPRRTVSRPLRERPMGAKALVLILAGAVVLQSRDGRPRCAADALEAYISYAQANCTDDGGIEGTFSLGYDDSQFADLGFSTDYAGDCLYFSGGSLDFSEMDDYTYEYSSFLRFGTCLTCSGAAGCAPASNATCDSIATGAAVVSSSTYESTGTFSGGNGSGSVLREPLTLFSKSMSLKIVASRDRTDESLGMYYMMGGLFCGFSFLGAVVAAERKRQLRVRNTAITESLYVRPRKGAAFV